jgi:hypothetical protein
MLEKRIDSAPDPPRPLTQSMRAVADEAVSTSGFSKEITELSHEVNDMSIQRLRSTWWNQFKTTLRSLPLNFSTMLR